MRTASLPAAEGTTQTPGGAPRSAHVVVFVSGPRPRVEAALAEARELYPSHDFAFVTEPECRDWLPEDAHNVVFVTPRPFRLFARTANALRRTLSARPIEACIFVVAGTGHESLRFRLFALRLSAREYFLLPRSISAVSSALQRSSFLAFAIAAVLLRGIRALSSLDAILLAALAWIIRFLPRASPRPQGGRKPQIAHLIPSIGTGGAQRQLALFLKNRTPEYEHRLLVLSSTDRFSAPAVTAAGIPVAYLDTIDCLLPDDLDTLPGSRRRRLPWLHLLLLFARNCFPMCGEVLNLALYLRTLQPRPDVLHCWLLVANVIGPPAARLAGLGRVVTSVRNIQSAVDYNYYDPRWQRAHERVTAPLADVIIANAPAVARDYRAFARVPAAKLVTVPNGIEIDTGSQASGERVAMRQTLGLAEDDLVVGTVARLAKEKDFVTFFRAIALARERLSALRVLIVGDGPLRSELELFAATLGLGKGVQFLGERTDAAAVLTSYDAFLLTSVIEGMPNVVMESQLAGVPVVATRAGGTVDLIRDGETGLLAPIGDAGALAAALVRLLTDTSLHDRISAAARRQIRSDFTAEMLVRRTEGVYQHLLTTAESRRPAPCAE